MGQLCCMYPEACHDYWGGKPWFPIHLTYLNSNIINIRIHLVPKWVQNSVKHLKFTWNAWECVCVCVEQCFKRPKCLKHLQSIFQFIRGIGQNWGKMWYFIQNYLCQLYLYYFAIVVIINKAFKLFKLVLVVYCDSCCHWWYPGDSAGQKNVICRV